MEIHLLMIPAPFQITTTARRKAARREREVKEKKGKVSKEDEAAKESFRERLGRDGEGIGGR